MASATHFGDWPNDFGFDTDSEHREPVELKVTGHIPPYATGTLYRTGPAQRKVKNTPRGDFELSHWFDGFSQVYRFEITASPDGTTKVVYNSRRQVDQLVDEIRKTGRMDRITFGQKREPCTSIFQKLKTVFTADPRTSNPAISNVAVTVTPNYPGLDSLPSKAEKSKDSRFDNLTLLTDNTRIKKIDPETLEPIGVCNQTVLHPDLKGHISAAHPQYDPLTGDAYNYNLDFGSSTTYRAFRTSAATGQTTILATLKGPDIKSAYLHSSFLTSSFYILTIWSSHFASPSAKILWDRNIIDSITFNASAPVLWLVIDRTSSNRGLVAKFTSPAAFAFHSINAWEERSSDDANKVDLYADVVQYENTAIIHRVYYENLLSTGPGAPKYSGDTRSDVRASLVRYQLPSVPLKGTSVSSSPSQAEIIKTITNPLAGDLPTHNPLYTTKRTRYVYSMIDRGLSSWMDGIAKTDVETGTAVLWSMPKHTPGEPIFVPDPQGKEEDDGVVLAVILDGEKEGGGSYLVCLEGKTLKEIGRAEVDGVVGYGFHGRFVGFGAEEPKASL